VTNISVHYDRASQTITCTSTGGPATDVTWSKDDVNIRLRTAPNEGAYEYSQIIMNTTSATYENRLRIVDKSSEAAGNYTCNVTNPRGSMNGSLYIQGDYYT
jgi:predicted Zn-dependent protease